MQTQMLIGGKWLDGSGSNRIEVLNPANGEVIAEVAAGTPADATAAVDAADLAQRSWAATAPRVRSEVLRNCWQTLINHTDELAGLITAEHGKPMADAKGEIAYAAEFFRWTAEEAVRIDGVIKTAPSGAHKILIHHPPVGVVVMVTPWNFPAAMITRKVAPALAAGNACVIKPPKETPLTALRVAELLEEAGVPAGRVNVVPTLSSGSWFEAATCSFAAHSEHVHTCRHVVNIIRDGRSRHTVHKPRVTECSRAWTRMNARSSSDTEFFCSRKRTAAWLYSSRPSITSERASFRLR